MGIHASKQCVDALAALLRAAVLGVEGRVYVGRVTPLTSALLPALVVDVADESIELATIHGPGMLQRGVAIDVGVIVREADGYDEAAYALLVDVEHAIAADPRAGNTSIDVTLLSVEFQRLNESDQPVVRATLRVRADVMVMSNAVDEPLV